MEESVILRDRIHSIMCHMSQNISTTECLLNGLRSKDDLVEIRGKMTEAASSIETLIPLLQTYMAQDEPENEEAKQQWWLERERINRDLENALKDFHTIHLVLDNCNNVTSAKNLTKTLIDLKTRTSGGLSNFKNFESYNKHREDNRPTSEIIEEIKRSPATTKQLAVTSAQIQTTTTSQLPATTDTAPVAIEQITVDPLKDASTTKKSRTSSKFRIFDRHPKENK